MIRETAAPLVTGQTVDVDSCSPSDSNRVSKSAIPCIPTAATKKNAPVQQSAQTTMPRCALSDHVHRIALLPYDQQMSATTAVARQYGMQVAVVASAVTVHRESLQGQLDDYRADGLPRQFKRWITGTENAVRHHANVPGWLVISEYAPSNNEPIIKGEKSLWLPKYVKPDDYNWPVSGRPVTCLLGEPDILRQNELTQVLLDHGAADVECRLTDSTGFVHVSVCKQGGGA